MALCVLTSKSFQDEHEFDRFCQSIKFGFGVMKSTSYISRLQYMMENVHTITRTSIIIPSGKIKSEKPLYKFNMNTRLGINTKSKTGEIQSAIKNWCSHSIEEEKSKNKAPAIPSNKISFEKSPSGLGVFIRDRDGRYIGLLRVEYKEHQDIIIRHLESIMDGKNIDESSNCVERLCSRYTNIKSIDYIIDMITPTIPRDLLDMEDIL